MHKTTKVSILVPIYGVEKYIARCAQSLFNQTYENIEYIFVNDCTTDKSIDILQEIIIKYPNRQNQIQILSHDKNRGLAAARNTALEACSGEFLIWVDSDDYIEKDCVDLCVQKQRETDADIVTMDFFKDFGDHKKPYFHKIPSETKDACISILESRIKHSVWGRLIRTSLYINNGIRVKEGLNMGEDRQVVPLLFYYANKVAHIEKPLYDYYEGNMSSYTASFSESKTDQSIESELIVQRFFCDKENDYRYSAILGEAAHLARFMRGCARANNKNYYKKLRALMDKIPQEVICKLSAFEQLPYRIKSIFILNIVVSIGHYIRIKKQ